MILKALYDYYSKNKSVLPQEGRELKEIGFIIVIDRAGKFMRIEDRRDENKKRGTSFLVKKHIGRSSCPVANYLYDNSSYVFGYSDSDKKKSNAQKCFQAFKSLLDNIYAKHQDNYKINALHLFYSKSQDEIIKELQKDPLWPEVIGTTNKSFSNFSFLINGDTTIVAEDEELLSYGEDRHEGGENQQEGICLITGNRGPIVETTTATMIPGSQATAKLVSFQVNSGYDSYGKQKCSNAPISSEAEFAYTTALNYLLRKDSKNKFLIGNRTYVFWASTDSEAGHEAEAALSSFLNIKSDESDDPEDNRVDKMRKVFTSIYSGSLKTTDDDYFYILGLAPAAARIAAVYWSEQKLVDFAGKILRHFDDMEIIDTRKEKFPYSGLFSILGSVTVSGKSSDIKSNLPEAVTRSIFDGTPYPYALYSQCIGRIRALGKNEIKIVQAAILKGYLNRLNDKSSNKISVMLDKNNSNQGYLCGRLFAVLVKIQEDGSGNNSIKERYMNAASATPSAVFSTLLNLSSHQQENLNDGSKVFYEKLICEIISKIDATGFPTTLGIQDQGRFFVGYYQQRQDLFTSKKDSNNQ